MTREQKMQAVVDAARTMAQRSEAGLSVLDARIAVTGALAALDAHTEAQEGEAAETVEVAMWRWPSDGEIKWCLPGAALDIEIFRERKWRRLGTVTLPITREGGR